MIMITKKGINKDSEMGVKIDKAVFPGLQGGPHNNTTAGILQALTEAEDGDFKKYGQQVIQNAKVLAEELVSGGLKIVTGKTECHLIVVDLRPLGLTGKVIAEALEAAGIVVNKNSVPNDSAPPFRPSGIRLGTPALTTRGMGDVEMKLIANWIIQIVKNPEDQKLQSEILDEVKALCQKFPII
jgi:glycine hydroxymethyltransferase